MTLEVALYQAALLEADKILATHELSEAELDVLVVTLDRIATLLLPR